MGEPRPRQATTLLRRAGSAGLLLLAVGCTTDGGRDNSKRDDPLLGIGARPAYQPAAVATTNPGTVAQGPPPPAYRPQAPMTAMPTSNAALAGNGFQPLQGGNDLRIGAGAPVAQQPVAQPVAGVSPVPPPGAPTPPPATPIGGNSLDQAYAAVTARGPLAYQMKFNSQTGEYTFQMKVPSRLNSAAIQSVEASAATPADAIRRTLEQLTN
jgi:hypothetical protein